MSAAARWLRRIEIALFTVGVSLLGVALAASVPRWQYQAQQERALFGTATTVDLPPSESRPARLLPGADPAAVAPDLSLEPLLDEEPDSEVIHERDAAPEPAGAAASLKEPDVARESRTSRPSLDAGVLGMIEIPRLGISAIVREGDDDATLRRAVGFVPGTVLPGGGGNTALAGHRDTFFRPLQRIEVHDHIRFVTPDEVFEYRVESLRVVEPTEVSVLDSTGVEELTLVTCYPFRFIGPAPDRFIVKATRVQ